MWRNQKSFDALIPVDWLVAIGKGLVTYRQERAALVLVDKGQVVKPQGMANLMSNSIIMVF